MLQRALNKWLPRGLEMFGDERGGGTNVRFGLKPMKNAEAQRQYYVEVEKLVRDLNVRYLRARVPSFGPSEADTALDRILAGETVEGIRREDLLHMPHPEFYRRRGVPAFKMAGAAGETFDDLPAYLRHLEQHLPDAYRAGRDYLEYVDTLRQVARGELEAKQAAARMPALRRVGGSCPCSKSVRWVVDEPRLVGDNPAAIETPVPATA
jgi:hypothetical protein